MKNPFRVGSGYPEVPYWLRLTDAAVHHVMQYHARRVRELERLHEQWLARRRPRE